MLRRRNKWGCRYARAGWFCRWYSSAVYFWEDNDVRETCGFGSLLALGMVWAFGGYQGIYAVFLAVRSPPSASTNIAQFPIVELFRSAAVMRVVALPCRFSMRLVILGFLQDPRM